MSNGSGWRMIKPHPSMTHLVVMLIGPAGAGKTSIMRLIFNEVDYEAGVLSVANMRHHLTGSTRDTYRDDEIEMAIPRILKARSWSGLPSIIDAPNLTRETRLNLMKQIPAGNKVMYIVVDRPLEDKLSTGGWRNHVMVGKDNLIEYQHKLFLNNLTDILAGDGLPYVEVKDLRDVKLFDPAMLVNQPAEVMN